ncbi:hypothetical protein [Helicobacter sp.]|uniref:hypothetical protein n=1 Tax=Helicobacter sp. TaxID=218 RepID=UPI0019CBE718|nr:hypothetical protein [Helicobacter sp.]MBD5166142.1 hypothetical protein [Helicobacter sp.]
MYPLNILEEDLKNKVAHDFFGSFDSTRILGKIDFCVSYHAKTLFQTINFLWAEAKKGNKNDIIESFVQLILTIGKERTFENELPPLFLGALDCEKIAFIPYYEIMDIFAQNDFNWNVAPSNHNSKEFKQLYQMSGGLLESKKLLFYFKSDSKELQGFIKDNFTLANKQLHKIQITKNNFTNVYQKWLTKVKDSISIDWNLAKNAGILDADFYLADLLSSENQSLLDKLFVVLKKTQYEFNKTITFMGSEQKDTATFRDNQKAHNEFWNLYERPPRQEYWDYIIDRRDLLVPSDIRERKGAFFTPQIWVQKAQVYLAKALGEDWQSESYVWDCAAGTGNLFANLTESHNFYASTLDKADVKIMKELAKNQHLPLLQNHIFQFDFLNDSLLDKPCERHKDKLDSTCKDCQASKLPKSLQEILKEETRRRKLIIFINPPYAEATSGTTPAGTGANKPKVATDNAIYQILTGKGKVEGINIESKDYLGKASNEIFAQFFMRIFLEIPHCKLAAFSTLKYINSSNFVKFRETFKAKFLQGFMCPADTFDNVKGQFPIGFLVWDLGKSCKE